MEKIIKYAAPKNLHDIIDIEEEPLGD